MEVVNDAKRGNVHRTPTKQTRFNGAKLVWMLKGSPLTVTGAVIIVLMLLMMIFFTVAGDA